MNLLRNAFAAFAAAAALAAAAHAQNDPLVLDQSNRANNTSNQSYVYSGTGEDTIVYSPVFIEADGGSQFRLNTYTVGLYRAASALAVDVEISVAEMTYDPTTGGYGLGTVRGTGTYSFAASTATGAVFSSVAFTWGSTDTAARPIINLQTQTQGANGWGGFWVGLRLKGPNASSTTNALRRVNEPTVGHSFNSFAKYTVSTAAFSNGWSFGNDASSQPYPSRMWAQVGGTVIDSQGVPAGLLYGHSAMSQWVFRPADAYDGVGSQTIYMPQFMAANPGDAVMPSKVVVGVRRGGTAAAPGAAPGGTSPAASIVRTTAGFGGGGSPPPPSPLPPVPGPLRSARSSARSSSV